MRANIKMYRSNDWNAKSAPRTMSCDAMKGGSVRGARSESERTELCDAFASSKDVPWESGRVEEVVWQATSEGCENGAEDKALDSELDSVSRQRATGFVRHTSSNGRPGLRAYRSPISQQ